ncbi:arginase family protein [Pseudonocardia humida]|uniref:Arginase family protein n=1 Tax=Pseudonocardia humida TaxID=2800819 RepID=A0ABT1ACU4_9PSEU|nr:arginase family protein [Pseudonocardia humida]MCO1660862.1 arginase family protein [Pseudonocardia humida]
MGTPTAAPATIRVPFHLDGHLPGLEVPLDTGATVRPELPPGSVWERLAALHAAVADEVAGVVATGGVPLVVSGCCTTALGTVAGLQRGGVDPAVVWLDAHGDLQTPQTSTSGYPGGMPLRQLVGGAERTGPHRLDLRPVDERDVVLVDARDLDRPEAEFLATSAIRRADVPGLVDLPLPDRPIYLHVDLDVLDPADVPGVMYPVAGGPRAEAVAVALRSVLDTGRVAAVGLACTWGEGVVPGSAVREVAAELARVAGR